MNFIDKITISAMCRPSKQRAQLQRNSVVNVFHNPMSYVSRCLVLLTLTQECIRDNYHREGSVNLNKEFQWEHICTGLLTRGLNLVTPQVT